MWPLLTQQRADGERQIDAQAFAHRPVHPYLGFEMNSQPRGNRGESRRRDGSKPSARLALPRLGLVFDLPTRQKKKGNAGLGLPLSMEMIGLEADAQAEFDFSRTVDLPFQRTPIGFFAEHEAR